MRWKYTTKAESEGIGKAGELLVEEVVSDGLIAGGYVERADLAAPAAPAPEAATLEAPPKNEAITRSRSKRAARKARDGS